MTPGNRSDRMPSNSGMSGARNFGRFTSFSERSMRMSSSWSGNFCFMAPAARSTEITARIP